MASASAVSVDDRGVIIPCESCRQANRVPFRRLGDAGQCAKCKAALPTVAHPLEVSTPASFQALTGGSAVPVLVDFWAPWCGPCRMVAPEVEKVAASAGGQFVVAKVNTEELPQVAGPLGIRSIPTFAVWAGGREVQRRAGALPAAELRAFALRAAGVSGW